MLQIDQQLHIDQTFPTTYAFLWCHMRCYVMPEWAFVQRAICYLRGASALYDCVFIWLSFSDTVNVSTCRTSGFKGKAIAPRRRLRSTKNESTAKGPHKWWLYTPAGQHLKRYLMCIPVVNLKPWLLAGIAALYLRVSLETNHTESNLHGIIL